MTEIQGILTNAGNEADKVTLLKELKSAVASYSGLTLPAHEDAHAAKPRRFAKSALKSKSWKTSGSCWQKKPSTGLN